MEKENQQTKKSKMNLPNRLTMIRLCLVPVIMVVLLLPESVLPWYIALSAGLLLFIVTSLTDMLDGKIARSRNLITDFGKFMDPVADKFMVIGTFLVLVLRAIHPAYFDFYSIIYREYFSAFLLIAVILLIFRELAVTSLRLILVNSSGKVVAANMLGKIKTVSQIVCICTLMIEPFIVYGIISWDPTAVLATLFPLSYLSPKDKTSSFPFISNPLFYYYML